MRVKERMMWGIVGEVFMRRLGSFMEGWRKSLKRVCVFVCGEGVSIIGWEIMINGGCMGRGV